MTAELPQPPMRRMQSGPPPQPETQLNRPASLQLWKLSSGSAIRRGRRGPAGDFIGLPGQSRHIERVSGTSALAPEADILLRAISVALGHVWTGAPGDRQEVDGGSPSR